MKPQNRENQLYLINLFFEPNNGAEGLDFPTMCKFIRETFHVTQAQMAQRLNSSLSGYQHWEYGKQEPSSKTAVNLFFMYLQALYIRNQTPRATEIKLLLDSLLNTKSSDKPSNKDKEPEVLCA